MQVSVATVDDVVAGFIAYDFNLPEHSGEIQLLAVHPSYQQRGIGTALNTCALEDMKNTWPDHRECSDRWRPRPRAGAEGV